MRRRAHRGAAAPGGRGAARPTPRSALGAGWKPGGVRAALPLRPLLGPPAGGLFMVLGMPGGKGRLRPWAEARLRAVGAGGAKPQEAAGSYDYRRNKYRREKYRGDRAKS